jgi:hypothetical protein
VQAKVLARSIGLLLVLAAAGCGKWFEEKDFSPTSPSILDALTLTPPRQSIPADGFTTAVITATITPDALLTRRTVVFVTTTGTFVGSPAPDKRTIERTVESSTGSATVELQSSRTVEIARVTATVKDVAGLGREVLVDFTPTTPADIIRISAPTVALADGATITPITAEISGALPAARRKVTFTTTGGGFVGAASPSDGTPQPSIEVDADGSNRATAFLRSPSNAVSTAFVTARVDSTPAVSASTSVQFVRALPQRVLVTVDKASLPRTVAAFTVVTCSLVREPGVPTEGTIITLRGVDSAGNDVGTFTKVQRSNAVGVATAEFFPGTLAAPGTLTISCTAEGITGTARIQLEM